MLLFEFFELFYKLKNIWMSCIKVRIKMISVCVAHALVVKVDSADVWAHVSGGHWASSLI